jgi:hypothetical protein
VSDDTVSTFRHTVTAIKAETESPGWQSVVSSNKIFGDLLLHFLLIGGNAVFIATGDRIDLALGIK